MVPVGKRVQNVNEVASTASINKTKDKNQTKRILHTTPLNVRASKL